MNRLFIFSIYFILIACQKDPTSIGPSNFSWQFAQPETQNLSSSLLDSALKQAQSTGFVDGILVIRNGYIVAEEYYNGYNQYESHNIMSVSKSFLSAITGIVFHQEFIDSLEVKVLDYFS